MILNVFLLLLISPILIYAQPTTNDRKIKISFAKESIYLSSPTSFFNVVTIENQSEEEVAGGLFITKPEKWTLIGQSFLQLRLSPGEKVNIPVRGGLPKNTLGGISYLIRAEFQTNDFYEGASCFVSVKKVSDWRLSLINSNVYLSDFRPVGDFKLKIENRGNGDELIKLDFDIGDLVRFKTFIEADSMMYIELPAYTDSIIQFEVYRRKDLTYSEQRTLLRNWRATSVYIKASTAGKIETRGLRITPLESEVINPIPPGNSPLNLDVNLYNLLSRQRPKGTFKIHGKILFPEQQQLNYSFGMYNLQFQPDYYNTFDFYRQLRYLVRYLDGRNDIWFGDRLGAGQVHTMTGSGIKARHILDDQRAVNMNLIYNPFGDNYGGHLSYETKIGKFPIHTGFTVESLREGATKYYSLHLGSIYNLNRKHTFRIQTATTYNSFSKGNILENDTATIGLAYRLGYYYSDRKFKFRFDNTNTKLSYLKNSGINRIKSDLRWRLTDKSRILGMYFRNAYISNRYPSRFFYKSNVNLNENGRLIYSFTENRIIYQAGLQYYLNSRKVQNPLSDISSTYRNFQPGILTSVTFRLDNMRSITTNLAVNTVFFNYESSIPENEPYSISGQWQYTVGLNFYDPTFRINAFYTSGEVSELYRSVVVEENPVMSQAIHLRPSFERFFFNDRIKLNASYNYSYFMPSQRENAITNVMSSFFLNNGWSLFSSVNLFKNTRVDDDLGRVTTRDLNMMVGFRKSFDIQQPRIKYYDLLIRGFNDVDGDGKKDANEKPISNVLINVKRDPDKNTQEKAIFAETKLITDPNGEIFYENIPEGVYDLEITPLSNLENLYFLDGKNQSLSIEQDKVHYLPLVESYKIRGKIIVDKDPNSNLGPLNLEGILVTAISETGSNYSVLTDNSGSYVLNLPKANLYTIKLYNVFGERFLLQQGTYEVQFVDSNIINIDFHFKEKRREIRFNGEGPVFQFNLDDDSRDP